MFATASVVKGDASAWMTASMANTIAIETRTDDVCTRWW